MFKLINKVTYQSKLNVSISNDIGDDYQVLIENGQRTIRSNKQLSQVMKSWEIFVGKIPKCVKELELFHLFSNLAGEIYELRIIFALLLNHYEIRYGWFIYVNKSVNNCSLYFGKLPKELKYIQFHSILTKRVSGIDEIFFPTDLSQEEYNRGYAFVKFIDHKSAFIAKKKLIHSLKFYGIKIIVDWSDPVTEPDPIIMKKVATLYLSNLAIETTTEDVRTHIRHLIPFSRELTRVAKTRNFCFVHFTKRKYAERAMTLIQGTMLLNKIIQVDWSKPTRFKKEITIKQIDRSYTSIPITYGNDLENAKKAEDAKNVKKAEKFAGDIKQNVTNAKNRTVVRHIYHNGYSLIKSE